ncbi:putative Ig domain-containing protein, partial [Sulfitobacter sp.]|uniref:Ig domain-containing protein n=1 Tax=Sulfitobacter sp. TaxID=1903071 RepID=UPI003EF8F6A8
VTVTATDQQGATASTSFIIGIENQAPVIATDLPDQSYTDGVAITDYDLTPGFTDNGDGLTLSITSGALPAGLSLVNGVITGTPTLDASQGGPTSNGIYTITVIATDSDNAVSTPQTITLTVENPVPTAGTIPTQTAVDGQTVSFDAAAAGGFADEDVLAYSVTGLPAGFAIDAATGVITGTFANTASTNAPFTVSVTATDNEGGTFIRSFTWNVSNPAPIAGVIANVTVDDASSLSVNAGSVFSDPDSDALLFDAIGLPEGLQIDPLTGIISGTIESNASQYGPYLITVIATDADGDRAESTFTITALNTPVTVTGTIPNIIANPGQEIPATGQDIFSDLDGDDLVITASNLPEGLQIDSQSGVISGSIAGTAEPGDYIVTVTATDGEGSAASVDFVITVLAEGQLTPENFVSGGYNPSPFDALQNHIPENRSERIATTVLLDALNNIQSIDMFGVTGTDAPINDTNDHLDDLQSQLHDILVPNFTNTFPIPLALVEGDNGASGFTANVLIGADRIFYNIETANGSNLELDPESPPEGVFIAPQGGIVIDRWVSEPFVVTIKTVNGDEVTYSNVQIDPQQNQFEITAIEVRKLLISERLEWPPSVY